jgi:hypothetical protein
VQSTTQYSGIPAFGVEPELGRAVVGQRAVGDLDHQERVLGPGVAFLVRRRTVAQDRQVGLGLGVVGEGDGALHPHGGAIAQACDQELGEVAHERLVATADGRHLDDLALDQLDAIVFAEDAHLDHPVVLRPRETSSRGHRVHCH